MPAIVFCTTCKNRAQHLKITLPHNLSDNPKSKFIVLDYNSGDDLLPYLFDQHAAEIEAGRLIVYSYRDAPIFRMAHAKNMAHRLGIREGADILVNLDADNLTGPGFDDFIAAQFQHNRDIFLWAHMIKGEMPRGISGRIAVSKQMFLKSGGYDETRFSDWGSDDKDFNLRMRLLGYEGVEIDRRYLNGVPHNDKIRFREYPHVAEFGDDSFEVSRHTISKAVVNGGSVGCGVVYRNRAFRKPIILRPIPTRIFGIGMHKTGTTSLHHAFQILGYDSWHWSSAHAAKAIWRESNNSDDGRSPTLERYYALCDLPITLMFERLDEAYPGSKFVLTVRSEVAWLDSVRAHWDPARNPHRAGWDSDPFSNRVHRILYGREDFDTDTMLARYRRHVIQVLAHFLDRPQDLLIMDMDAGAGWAELCDFLDAPPQTAPYPRRNGTPAIR